MDVSLKCANGNKLSGPECVTDCRPIFPPNSNDGVDPTWPPRDPDRAVKVPGGS